MSLHCTKVFLPKFLLYSRMYFRELKQLMITASSMLCIQAPQYGQLFMSLGKILCLNLLTLTMAYLRPVSCRKCYNLCDDGICAWPVANCPRWSKIIVAISWQDNKINIKNFETKSDFIGKSQYERSTRQQSFDLIEKHYANPIIINHY